MFWKRFGELHFMASVVFVFCPTANDVQAGAQPLEPDLAPNIVVAGEPFEVNCNAEVVQAPDNFKILSRIMILRRFKHTAVDVVPIASLTRTSKSVTDPNNWFPEGRNWTFKFIGGSSAYRGSTREMNIQWTIHDTKCGDDEGYYFCNVMSQAPGPLFSRTQNVTAIAPLAVSIDATPRTKKHLYASNFNLTISCVVHGPPNTTLSVYTESAISLGRLVPIDEMCKKESPFVTSKGKCDSIRHRCNISFLVKPYMDGQLFLCTANYDKHKKSANLALAVKKHKPLVVDWRSVKSFLLGFTSGFFTGVVILLCIVTASDDIREGIEGIRSGAASGLNTFGRMQVRKRFIRAGRRVRRPFLRKKPGEERSVSNQSSSTG